MHPLGIVLAGQMIFPLIHSVYELKCWHNWLSDK